MAKLEISPHTFAFTNLHTENEPLQHLIFREHNLHPEREQGQLI